LPLIAKTSIHHGCEEIPTSFIPITVAARKNPAKQSLGFRKGPQGFLKAPASRPYFVISYLFANYPSSSHDIVLPRPTHKDIHANFGAFSP